MTRSLARSAAGLALAAVATATTIAIAAWAPRPSAAAPPFPRSVAVLRPARAAAELDPASRAALARLPFDTAIVASLDLAAARRTQAGQHLLSALERARAVQKVAAELRARVGFDVQRDLARLWVALPSGAFAGADRSVLVAELTIDQARFLDWLRRRIGNGFAERRAGQLVYYVANDAALAFVDQTHMLITQSSYIEEALRVASGARHSAAANRPLVTVAAAAARPDAHAWFAVLVSDGVRADLRQGALTASLSDVQWTTAALTFDSVTRWQGDVRTSKSASATALAPVLRQMIEVAARSEAVAAAGLADAIGKTRVAADRETVHLEGSLPRAQASAALKAVLEP